MNVEHFEWYYLDSFAKIESQRIKGPVSLRDIDVLYRTKQINSNTQVCKTGMKEWQPLFKIEELKQQVMKVNEEMNLMPVLPVDGIVQTQQQQEQTSSKIDEPDEEEKEYLKLLEENPEKALEQTVDNMVNQNFFKDEETGKWKIYDEEAKTWTENIDEPIEQKKKMRETLLSTMKSQFLGQGGKKQKKDLAGLSADEIKKIEKNRKNTKRQAEKKKQKLRELKMRSFIYITNLPSDITMDEMEMFFGKAGIIKEDLNGNKKIKIYRDEEEKCKGDATVGYEMEESVQIALEMLDGRFITQENKIKIERAQFDFTKTTNQENGQDDNLNKKREAPVKLDKLQLLKLNQKKQKQQGWEEDDQIRGMQQVIIKNMFDPKQVQEDEYFIQDLTEDLQVELTEMGKVLKLKIYENHPEGVVQVKFSHAHEAEKCIQIMHERFFDGRVLQSDYWDGKTDYDNSFLFDNNLNKKMQLLESIDEHKQNQDEKNDNDDDEKNQILEKKKGGFKQPSPAKK